MSKTADERAEEEMAENMVLSVKHAMPGQLAHLRKYLNEGCGELTDGEFDELLIKLARTALRGESPAGLRTNG